MNQQLLANQALALQQQGRAAEAASLYAQILAVQPANPQLLFNQGRALRQLGRAEEALDCFEKALAIRPDFAMAQINRGLIFLQLERYSDALASFDAALAVTPQDVGIYLNRGVTLSLMMRLEDAVASYDAGLRLQPGHPALLNNRGLALSRLGRHEEALANYDALLAANPRNWEALNNRGLMLASLGRFDEALAAYAAALTVNPGNAETLNNRGAALLTLERFAEALENFNAALAANPGYLGALSNHGLALAQLGRTKEALASFDAALALDPDHIASLSNRATQLLLLNRFAQARASYEKVLALDPGNTDAICGLAETALRACDWPRTAKIAGDLKPAILAGKRCVSPFYLLGYSDDAELQRHNAANHVAARVPATRQALWDGRPYRNGKIKIAYLSADFRDHPTAHLMAGLFEHHDRTRCDVSAISFGPDDGSAMRTRLTNAFDHFVDVRGKSDRDIAGHLAANRIDIAIDLAGHTQNERLGILALRPAPVQLSYLVFPGTMGADFIDYVVADEIVLPRDQQPFFPEKIIHLPHSYQANDSRRPIAPSAPTRAEARLPEQAFVFCCFNNSWKITAPIFDIWMRLLQAVPQSVLWLLDTGISDHLRQEAVFRGMDPRRLVFAARTTPDQHLARHRLADLFLDTLPYNAHTTASDALWAGLPVVTSRGKAFAGRVAASLLHATGLPELVTDNLEEYEALSLKLAREPALLNSIRLRLQQNRLTCPLFDTARFCRHIEAAYVKMRDIAERGEPPQPFSIDD